MRVGNHGFSLVELMIAILLALMLMVLMTTAFIALQASSNQTRQLAFLQQNGQMALNLLNNELQNTGFWGGSSSDMVTQALAAIPLPSTDCLEPALDSGSFPLPDQPFISLYAGVATGSRQLSCLNNLLAGTEFLQIKRGVGGLIRPAEMRGNRFYLELDWQHRRFVDISTASPDAMFLFPYQHLVLYIQQQQHNGTTVPVLMRKRLVRTASGGANMRTDSILDGVERLHFMFLIDSSGDGRPNFRLATSEMTAGYWLQQESRIVAVQYYVLLRSVEPDPRYINNQQYQLGSMTFSAPGDHYRRMLLSGAVYFENAILANF